MSTSSQQQPPCTDQLVLVGGDGGEDGLCEHPALVPVAADVGEAARPRHPRPALQHHQVQPRLELVHRVQHDLPSLQTIASFALYGLSTFNEDQWPLKYFLNM